MFRVSFHFDCIYFRGSSMISPYLPITCSQFVLEHRSCMLIYILQWLPWPGSWVTAAATRWSSYLLPGTAQKRIVGSCIRDRHRRNEEGGSCNWICLLKNDMEPNSSSDESGGEGRAGSWHWALTDKGMWVRSRVVSEMTLGFRFWIIIEDGASLAAWENTEEKPGTVRHSAVISAEMSLGQLLGHGLPRVMQGVHIHATLHMVPSISVTEKRPITYFLPSADPECIFWPIWWQIISQMFSLGREGIFTCLCNCRATIVHCILTLLFKNNSCNIGKVERKKVKSTDVTKEGRSQSQASPVC